MDIIVDAFNTVLNMTITGTIIAIVIFLLRLCMKKLPRRYSYMLWGILGIRLLCPFSFSSAVSLFNLLKPETVSSSQMIYAPYESEYSGFSDVEVPSDTEIPVPELILPPEGAGNIEKTADLSAVIESAVPYIWLSGLVIMLIYSVISYISVKKRVSGSNVLRDNIYLCEWIETPFVYGIIKPKIYIPANTDRKDIAFIIAHESVHIKRFDHIIKLISLIALSVHWFNPVIWLSFKLMVRDMELSCDERAVSGFETDVRKDYASALLNISMKHNGLTYGGLLSFGESSIKSRIKGILKSKKPAVWVSVIGAVLIIIAGVCLLTNAGTEEAEIISEEKTKLTLDDVRSLIKKGDKLTWSDFDGFEGKEIGHGLYIMCYEISDEHNVTVGGVPDEEPWYIYLNKMWNGERHSEIELRECDSERLERFIEMIPTATGPAEEIPEEREFLYNDVEFQDEMSGCGVPMSYEELHDYVKSNLCFLRFQIVKQYSAEEALEISGNSIFENTSTLYAVHIDYDYVNKTPLDLTVYFTKVGVPESQVENEPPYLIGEIYAAAFNDIKKNGNNSAFPELKFAVSGDYAYHMGGERIEFVDESGKNLDLGLSEKEKYVYTSTSNNPVKYTKRILLEELVDFFKKDWEKRGYNTVPVIDEDENIKEMLSPDVDVIPLSETDEDGVNIPSVSEYQPLDKPLVGGEFTYDGYVYSNYNPSAAKRYVIDNEGIILEPEYPEDNIDGFMYNLNEYDYIGTGADFNWGSSETKLYRIADGYIIAVFPYGNRIDYDYEDKEEILSEYSRDMLYGVDVIEGAAIAAEPENADEDAMPIMPINHFIMYNGEVQVLFPDYGFFVCRDGVYYNISDAYDAVGSSSFKLNPDIMTESSMLKDVIDNYIPTGQTSYSEEPKEDFETNIEAFVNADVYCFEEGYPMDFYYNSGSYPEDYMSMLIVDREPYCYVDEEAVYCYGVVTLGNE